MTTITEPTTAASGGGAGLEGTAALARIIFRRYRFRLFCWIAPIVILVLVTVPSYAGSYPDLASRGPLVARLRTVVATEVMYGQLPLPGTLGQLAQWEVGAYAVLLTVAMAVTLTVSMTRVDEDLGRTELVATAGLGRWSTTAAVATVTVLASVILGGLTGAVLAVQAIGSAELTVAGAFAFGGALTVTGIGISASTLLVSELFWDAASTRAAAWTVVAIEFGVRIAADLTSWHWLRGVTWFGVKDLVAPYTFDRITPLVTGIMMSGCLFATALAVRAHREFGAGLLRAPHRSVQTLRVASSFGLAWRLGRGSLVVWLAPVIALSTLFGGMSHTLITLASSDQATATLFANLSSVDGLARQYFSFTSVFIVILPMMYGVHTVLDIASTERRGLLDTELGVGVARDRPLLARTAVATCGAVGLLMVGAVGQSATTLLVSDVDTARWAFATAGAAVFGILAAVGSATLLVGAAPRWAQLMWAAVVWSAFAQLFGELVKLPPTARSLSLLGHGPDDVRGAISGLMPWAAVAILTGLAVATTAIGAASMRRRDITVG